MRMVFSLQDELRRDPERVRKTQALTLNDSKPKAGLRGAYGLFGSQEWWDSIASGRMPLLYISGVIESIYVAGQDQKEFNTVDIRMIDGGLRSAGIYLNDKANLDLFEVGRMVAIVYALDELKQQPSSDGGINVSRVALEMAVSL